MEWHARPLCGLLLCMLIPFAAALARSTSTYGGATRSRSIGTTEMGDQVE